MVRNSESQGPEILGPPRTAPERFSIYCDHHESCRGDFSHVIFVIILIFEFLTPHMTYFLDVQHDEYATGRPKDYTPSVVGMSTFE